MSKEFKEPYFDVDWLLEVVVYVAGWSDSARHSIEGGNY